MLLKKENKLILESTYLPRVTCGELKTVTSNAPYVNPIRDYASSVLKVKEFFATMNSKCKLVLKSAGKR